MKRFKLFRKFVLTGTTNSGSSSHPMLDIEVGRAFLATDSFRVDQVNLFPLSSGRPSPYYINCKQLLSHPKHRLLLARAIFNSYKDILDSMNTVGGMEIGAIPIAQMISDYYLGQTGQELRTFAVRKKPKEHGLGLPIEGDIKKGDRALVVDDVLTTGKSTKDAIESARDAGLVVEHVLVLVDRCEQDGKQNLETLGVKVLSLITLPELRQLREESRTKQNSSVRSFLHV
jgi:orotate phosphoribosyltransferase